MRPAWLTCASSEQCTAHCTGNPIAASTPDGVLQRYLKALLPWWTMCTYVTLACTSAAGSSSQAQAAPVACNVGHGREGVKRLRSADGARYAVHGCTKRSSNSGCAVALKAPVSARPSCLLIEHAKNQMPMAVLSLDTQHVACSMIVDVTRLSCRRHSPTTLALRACKASRRAWLRAG